MGQHPTISVIVCTYDRCKLLGLALDSLATQTTSDLFTYEVIVVDDASADDTCAVVMRCSDSSSISIRYIRADGHGISAARNIGIKNSSSEWVAFFDDDQLADSHWLLSLFRAAKETRSWCVGGRRLLRFMEKPEFDFDRTCRTTLGEIDYGPERMICSAKNSPAAGNLLLKRALFESIGTFDESVTNGGEETDLFIRVRRAGMDPLYVPDAIAYHLIPAYRTKDEYFRWASLRYGDSFANRDYMERGAVKLMLTCVARIAQVLILKSPSYVIDIITNAPQHGLGCKCYFWRTRAYLSKSISLIAPRIFRNESLTSTVQFRKERSIFKKYV